MREQNLNHNEESIFAACLSSQDVSAIMTTKHSWHDSVVNGNARKAQHWKYERGKMSTEKNMLPFDLNDEDVFLGEVVDEPTPIIRHGKKYYSCAVDIRKLKNKPLYRGRAYLILVVGEVVPVFITGTMLVHPTPEAVRSGHWKPDIVYPLFSADGFTEEQVKRAHTFVQHKMYI
jgi:hypothetical protein